MSTEHQIDTESIDQCAVCLENLGPHNITTLECGHRFHYTCIQHWHREHSNCPCCRANVLENEPQTQTHNLIQEHNNVDTGYLLHQIAFHGHDIDVSATCNRCDGEVIICEGCGYNMCFCNINRTSRNGKNPFSSENDCFTCLECFNNRDATLIDWLMQSWAGDVFNREFIIEHYETYFVDNSEQNHPNHRSFTDYHDFIEYAEELLREHYGNDVNNQISFEDVHGGFTQEEIDDINDMNSRYQNEMNNEINNIRGNIENTTTHFNETINILNMSDSINEIISNNITIDPNSVNEHITIEEFNQMLS